MAAPHHRQTQLGVDGVGRDVEFARDGLVGEAVETAEGEDFLTTGRKRGDGFVQDFDFLIMRRLLRCIRSLLYHGQLLDIP